MDARANSSDQSAVGRQREAFAGSIHGFRATITFPTFFKQLSSDFQIHLQQNTDNTHIPR